MVSELDRTTLEIGDIVHDPFFEEYGTIVTRKEAIQQLEKDGIKLAKEYRKKLKEHVGVRFVNPVYNRKSRLAYQRKKHFYDFLHRNLDIKIDSVTKYRSHLKKCNGPKKLVVNRVSLLEDKINESRINKEFAKNLQFFKDNFHEISDKFAGETVVVVNKKAMSLDDFRKMPNYSELNSEAYQVYIGRESDPINKPVHTYRKGLC